jgi:DNA-binding NtrC family response regulator
MNRNVMKKIMKMKLVVVGPDRILTDIAAEQLTARGFEPIFARSLSEGVQLAVEHAPATVLLNVRLLETDAIAAIAQLRQAVPDTRIIATAESANPCVRTADEAMQAGAHEYLVTPFETEHLLLVLEGSRNGSSKAQGDLKREGDLLPNDPTSEILGDCPAIRDLRSRIIQIGAVDKKSKHPRPVLITGETGTGKQLVARALHCAGDRGQKPFIEVNCGAIPSELMESELFGFEKGAFTDAKVAKPGLFEVANGGTLFLDEICSMDPVLQVKLLKAIEDKTVRRIGSTKAKQVDVRVIAATNCAFTTQKIRPDLFYRLMAFSFVVPPLRERGTDILLLVRFVLDRVSREFARPLKQLSQEAEELLMQGLWPGNVRELIHAVEQAVLFHEGDTVKPEHFQIGDASSRCPVQVNLEGQVAVDFSKGGIHLEGVERQLIVRALTHAEWNRGKAAQLLGISKETLRYRMEKFRLAAPGPQDPGPGFPSHLFLLKRPSM